MPELTPYLKERLEKAKRDLAQQKDWYSELIGNELVQINGLVSQSYPHGDSFAELDEWSVIFSFDGWTDGDGIFHDNELVVRKVVKQEESDLIKALVQPREIVTISCHIGMIKDIDRADAGLVSVVSTKVSDERLVQHRNDLDAPVVLKSDTFGQLILDRSVNWFEGKVRTGFRKVRVNIEPKSISETCSAITIAERAGVNRKFPIELAMGSDEKGRDQAGIQG